MPLARVRVVPVPSQSRLSPLYKSAYFIDAFAITLPPPPRSKGYQADALARTFFPKSPAWFSMLMWIRDRVISLFGVKTSTEIKAAAAKRGVETIGFFPVLSKTDSEIIVGEKDKHLDFQTSILIRDSEVDMADSKKDDFRGSSEMVVLTVVHCHGLFGKAYITIIKAFHVLIVKYSLARMPDRITTAKDY
jgi:hypothetical protein